MTYAEQIQTVQQQLGTALLRKEQITGELDSLNTQIRALRNVLEGVKLGQDALREAAERQMASDAAAAAPSAQ